MQTLNIILPVLNEEQCLAKNIHQIKTFLDSVSIPYYLTIVDNGSTDNTKIIAKKLCSQYTHIDYLSISQKGVGIALRKGILHNLSRKNPCAFIGYMDIDLSTNLAHLKKVYELLCGGEKIVVGSRLLKDSEVIGRSLKREITSRGLNLILRFVLNTHFSDAMCGFKFYEIKTAQTITARCYDDNGWFYCAQMLIVAQYCRIPIREIPIVLRDDRHSKVKIISLSLSYMREIFRLFLIRIKGKL